MPILDAPAPPLIVGGLHPHFDSLMEACWAALEADIGLQFFLVNVDAGLEHLASDLRFQDRVRAGTILVRERHLQVMRPALRYVAIVGGRAVDVLPGENDWILTQARRVPDCYSQGKTRKEALDGIAEALALRLETRPAAYVQRPIRPRR